MTSKELKPLVVLTGAGISAESGIPTFRGNGGLWERHRVVDLATPESFQRDPELVWRFYNWRREMVAGCRPNQAHETLAEIERLIPNFTLITQNIDGLHHAAGNQRVLELHGSIWRLRCSVCAEHWEDRRAPIPEPVPTCPACGKPARPDVVWFGEGLDMDVLQSAQQAVARTKLMLIIGTSAIVHPAAALPLIARNAGAHLVEINMEATPLTPLVDEILQGPATQQLGE
ncbi:MAG: NAD-dependent deacylase, partial [Anaerolineales bacterium]